MTINFTISFLAADRRILVVALCAVSSYKKEIENDEYLELFIKNNSPLDVNVG